MKGKIGNRIIATVVCSMLFFVTIDTLRASEMAKYGSIEGYISYPSEGFPPDLRVFAKNIDTNEKYSAADFEPNKNDSRMIYHLKLPAGRYIVYAKTEDRPYKAYYSESDGYKANASHKPIVIELKGDDSLSNINPVDWYDNKEANMKREAEVDTKIEEYSRQILEMYPGEGVKLAFYKNDGFIGYQIINTAGSIVSSKGRIPDGIVNEYDAETGSLKKVLYYQNDKPDGQDRLVRTFSQTTNKAGYALYGATNYKDRRRILDIRIQNRKQYSK